MADSQNTSSNGFQSTTNGYLHGPGDCKDEKKQLSQQNINYHKTKDYVKHECPHSCSNSAATYEIAPDNLCHHNGVDAHPNTHPLEEMECRFSKLEEILQEQEEKLQEQKKNFEETLWKQERGFEEKLQEEKKKFDEIGSRFEEKLQEQEKNFKETLQKQEKKFENKLKEQEEKFRKALENLQGHMEEKMIRNGTEMEQKFQVELDTKLHPNWQFRMDNFSQERAKNKVDDWKSPAMYTHLYGYTFCIGIDANGFSNTRGNSVNVELWQMQGKFDEYLKWPVKITATLELINHYEGGENKRASITTTWEKPKLGFEVLNEEWTPFLTSDINFRFIEHSELDLNHEKRTHFLKDDCLHFKIANITTS